MVMLIDEGKMVKKEIPKIPKLNAEIPGNKIWLLQIWTRWLCDIFLSNPRREKEDHPSLTLNIFWNIIMKGESNAG